MTTSVVISMTANSPPPTEADAKYRSSWSLPGSAERNAQPIAEALSPLLSPASTFSRKQTVLEVASGFGHQLRAIASSYPHCQFHPSEVDAIPRSQIDSLTSDLANVSKAEALDLVVEDDWLTLVHNVAGEAIGGEQGLFDGVLACNLTHIVPWKVTESLFSHLDPRVGWVTQGGYRNLLSRTNGWVAIYGAFNEDGEFTSEGNKKFDEEIRKRDKEFGLRDVQRELVPLAWRHGYELERRVEMPAGNLLLVFRVRKE